MDIQDDRSSDQKLTHRYLVVGTDRFLSGWGRAEGGASYAAWACKTSEEVDKAMAWVGGRSVRRRVRLVVENPSKGYTYRPKADCCAHLHIYMWTDR
jgi:hypothetical protein